MNTLTDRHCSFSHVSTYNTSVHTRNKRGLIWRLDLQLYKHQHLFKEVHHSFVSRQLFLYTQTTMSSLCLLKCWLMARSYNSFKSSFYTFSHNGEYFNLTVLVFCPFDYVDSGWILWPCYEMLAQTSTHNNYIMTSVQKRRKTQMFNA